MRLTAAEWRAVVEAVIDSESMDHDAWDARRARLAAARERTLEKIAHELTTPGIRREAFPDKGGNVMTELARAQAHLARLREVAAERDEAGAEADRQKAGMRQVALMRAANAAAVMGHGAIATSERYVDALVRLERAQGELATAWAEGFDAAHEWWMRTMEGRPGDPPANPYERRSPEQAPDADAAAAG